MPNLRKKTWADYGISTFRYRELKNFCLQYNEKKQSLSYGLASVDYSKEKVQKETTSDPTQGQAIKNSKYFEDINLIESCANETNSIIAPYLLKSVTENLPYELVENLEPFGKIPMSRQDFYAYRRLFYYNLSKKKS